MYLVYKLIATRSGGGEWLLGNIVYLNWFTMFKPKWHFKYRYEYVYGHNIPHPNGITSSYMAKDLCYSCKLNMKMMGLICNFVYKKI